MRVLWITPSLPCPVTGSRARQLNLIKSLATQYDFSVLSFTCDFEQEYVELLDEYCERVLVVPLRPYQSPGRWQNRLQSWRQLFLDRKPKHVRTYPMGDLVPFLDRLLLQNQYDIVHMETLHSALLRDQCGLLPAVLSTQNVESQIQYRQLLDAGSLTRRIWCGIECLKLKKFETVQLRSFSTCVAVSETDAKMFRELESASRVFVVPNGVDCSYFAAPEESIPDCRTGILFTGTMNYSPNVDGVLSFCREIWPLLRQASPEITLTIAGANPVVEVVALDGLPGITVTGFVEDIRPYFWDAAVAVVPLRVGGGTRLKILESMAAGLPVVSTTIGAEGLDVSNGENIFLADTPVQFADAVIRVLRTPDLARKLSMNGRRLVEKQYDWKIIAQRLDEAYQSLFC